MLSRDAMTNAVSSCAKKACVLYFAQSVLPSIRNCKALELKQRLLHCWSSCLAKRQLLFWPPVIFPASHACFPLMYFMLATGKSFWWRGECGILISAFLTEHLCSLFHWHFAFGPFFSSNTNAPSSYSKIFSSNALCIEWMNRHSGFFISWRGFLSRKIDQGMHWTWGRCPPFPKSAERQCK